MVKKAQPEPVPEAAPPKKDKGADNGAAKSGAGGLARYTLITTLGCVLALLAGAFVIQTQVLARVQHENGERFATAHARQYVAFFNQVISQATRQMAGIAGTGDLAQVMMSGDEARLQATAANFAAALASRSQVFLLPGSGGSVPLGFAAQDLAERARRGAAVAPEVIPLKDRPLLLLAQAIRAEGQIVGVMLVGFDLNEISANLKAFDDSAGQMRLLQQLDGADEQAVLSYGKASVGSSAYSARVPTLFPSLVVEYSLDPQSIASQTADLFWVFVAAMGLLVVTSIFLTNLLLDRTLRRNTSMLLQHAESLLRGSTTPAGIQFTINFFEEAAGSLSRIARELPRGGSARAAAPVRKATVAPDALDVDMVEDTLVGGDDAPTVEVPDEIFRAYDIRGVVGRTLSEEIMVQLGRAIGSEALDRNEKAIYVGRDGRLSGPQLLEALVEGLTSTGCRVINLGMVPTPVVYFAAANSAVKSGIVLTGSHNPKDYNGLKIVIAGETLAEERIQALKQRIRRQDFRSGKGSAETADYTGQYSERIRDDIVLARPMKIVVDCGNGIAGALAPQVLSSIGCSIVPLYCDVDGHFPNHHPDPSKPDNLRDLVATVAREGADLGLAFDGDGDRIGVVTPHGDIIWPDRLMMLYAKDLLMRNPGADIIYDVKCTRDLGTVISQNGGRPVMWRTGHSLIKAKLKETNAALAGEMSGHIFFNDRWPGFDDAIYAAARLLEILSLEVGTADEVFAEFPVNFSTPELNIDVADSRKFAIIESLQKQGDFAGGSMTTIDGVRVDFPDGWGLLRASNTTPTLVARFEGRTEDELSRIKTLFREQLAKVDPSLRTPF